MAVPALPLAVRRARGRGHAASIAFDGACLRGKCEADHELGYQLMRRFAAVAGRAPAGHPAPAARRLWPRPSPAEPPRADDGARAVPRSLRDARRRPTRGRSSSSRAAAPLAFAPGQFTMLSPAARGEVPISISGDPAEPGRLVHTVRAVGARDARDLRRRAGRRARRARPVRPAWPVDGGRGRATSWSSPAASGSRRCGPRSCALLARRERYGRLVLLYGGRTPDAAALPRRARRLARRAGSTSTVTVDAPARSGSGTSASCRG